MILSTHSWVFLSIIICMVNCEKAKSSEETCDNFYEDYSCEMFRSRGLCKMFRKYCRLTCGVCELPATTTATKRIVPYSSGPKPTRPPTPTTYRPDKWSSCTKSCGGGTRYALLSRRCTNPNNHRCLRVFEECNTHPCLYRACRKNQMKRYGYKKGCCKRRGPSVTKYLAKLKSANKGKSFSDNKWPWMALITSFNDVCNGALIHPQWVVTAAHCVMSGSLKTSTSRMFVYVGINDLAYSTSKNKYRVRRTIPHPKYRQMQNDIALIQLTKPVQSRYANFLSFPRNEVTPLDTTCMVVGWGINRSLRISASSNPVHQTDQQIFDMNVCRREFKDDKILKNYVMKKSPKMLCAGSLTEENKICTGYEGSPLICQRCSSCEWYIAGVTSTNRRSSCGKRGHPNLFTQTRAFEDWVCKFIPDLNQSPVKCPYKYGP